MLKKLIISNFRSIRYLVIEFDMLNAFIGPNNSGKTNIMKALDILLGNYWPSVRSFSSDDFYNYSPATITFTAYFDSPFTKVPANASADIYGFSLEYDGKSTEFYAIDNQGQNVFYSGSTREIRVNSDMRDEASMMFLGVNRQAYQQIKSTGNTLYSKILNYIESQMTAQNKYQYSQDVDTAYQNHISPHLLAFQNSMKQFTKEQTGLDLEFKFSILKPTEALSNFLPYIKDATSNIEFDLERVGLGVQSAIAVSVARVYSQIIQKPLIMAIEEPELYLHPHACRHFYDILKNLTDENIQVIYTTHSNHFVNITNHKSINLVRKINGETKVSSGINLNIPQNNIFKLAAKIDERKNEVFFAEHVILVEGPTDKIAHHCSFDEQQCNLDEKNVSIISCESKDEICYIAKILKHFNITCYAVFDTDNGHPQTTSRITEAESLLGPDFVFKQHPDLEAIIGYSGQKSQVNALRHYPTLIHANLPQVFVDLKNKIYGP